MKLVLKRIYIIVLIEKELNYNINVKLENILLILLLKTKKVKKLLLNVMEIINVLKKNMKLMLKSKMYWKDADGIILGLELVNFIMMKKNVLMKYIKK